MGMTDSGMGARELDVVTATMLFILLPAVPCAAAAARPHDRHVN